MYIKYIKRVLKH